MPAFPDDPSAEITAPWAPCRAARRCPRSRRRLLDLFTSGSIAPGTRLPPERQLAATLGVGRSAVREALAALEILGIVDVRPGRAHTCAAPRASCCRRPSAGGSSSGSRTPPSCSNCAPASRSTSHDSPQAGSPSASSRRSARHLDRMRADIDDLKAFVQRRPRLPPRARRRRPATTTLVDMLQVVRSLLRVWADRAVHDEADALIALEEHDAVYQALAATRPDAAASAMATHMATARPGSRPPARTDAAPGGVATGRGLTRPERPVTACAAPA